MGKSFRTQKPPREGAPFPVFRPSSAAIVSVAIALLLALKAFLIYWPSLHSDFVYDSRLQILEEGFITSWTNLSAVLSLKVLAMNLQLGTRPGQLLFMMILAEIWGKDPFGFHLASNLLHAANVVLLFFLLMRLGRAETSESGLRLSFAGAVVSLIFAVHPMMVEAVSVVSYSSDLLVTFFALAALLAASHFRIDRPTQAWGAGAVGTFCVLAAVMCKESGVSVAPLLVCYWLVYHREEKKVPWMLFLGASILVSLIFLTIRFYVAQPVVGLSYLGGSLAHVFWIQPRLWVFMMGKLVWPDGFSADYMLDNVSGVSTSVAFIALTMVILLQVWLARKSRLGAMGVAIYWLGLATVSNFVPLNRILADRFYYLPMAGVAMQLLAMILLVACATRLGWWAVLPLAGAIPLLASLNLARQAVFANEFALWTATLQVTPRSATACSDLGYACYQAGRLDEAIMWYGKALDLDPHFAMVHYDLGLALLKSNRPDEAMPEFRRALEINPSITGAHRKLGQLLSGKGRTDEAINEYRLAIEGSPGDAESLANLGVILLKREDLDGAQVQIQRALKIDPGNAQAHNNLGIIFAQKGKMGEAKAEFEEALRLDPNVAGAKTNLEILKSP